MITQANVMDSPVVSRADASPAEPVSRPLYWSVRRELWENRSLYVAPLLVAAVVLFGFMISTIGLPHRRRAVMLLDEAHQRSAIGMPYDLAATMILITSFIVAAFYCFDALYGERRDRSLLFWKSLPVSDRTTVLSKASIPMVIMPAIAFATTIVTQMLMLWWSTTILLLSGLSPAAVFPRFRFVPSPYILIYGLVTIVLWHAPIYSWFLLISAWAKRAVFLIAVLPFLVIAAVEKMTFNTSYFGLFLKYRLIGGATEAFVFGTNPPHLTPANYLSTPGLWLGLLFAAACLAAAVRLRRNRESI